MFESLEIKEASKIKALLELRYIVYDLFPGTKFELGDILINSKRAKSKNKWYVKGQSFKTIQDPEMFPSIFKSAPWWAGRDLKVMPEYIKIPHGPEVFYAHYLFNVYKVLGWETRLKKTIAVISNPPKSYLLDMETSNSLPATMKEYHQYLEDKSYIP
jgi:hypothetical protein